MQELRDLDQFIKKASEEAVQRVDGMRGYSAQRRSPPQSDRKDPTSPAAALAVGGAKAGGFAAADAQAARAA